MYIVQMGEAEVLEDERSPPVVLKQGDIFGEVSFEALSLMSKFHKTAMKSIVHHNSFHTE